MTDIPIASELIKKLANTISIPSLGRSSIREIAQLVNRIEENTGIKFIRMEMGVPGLPDSYLTFEAALLPTTRIHCPGTSPGWAECVSRLVWSLRTLLVPYPRRGSRCASR